QHDTWLSSLGSFPVHDHSIVRCRAAHSRGRTYLECVVSGAAVHACFILDIRRPPWRASIGRSARAGDSCLALFGKMLSCQVFSFPCKERPIARTWVTLKKNDYSGAMSGRS